MDEYIKREDVKRAITCSGDDLIFDKGKIFIPFSVVRSAIENTPTSDVVPKSEVERLEHILNSYALQYGTVKDQHEVIAKIKAEVTREIFNDIKRVLYIYHCACGKKTHKRLKKMLLEGERKVIELLFEQIIELENKYMEEYT